MLLEYKEKKFCKKDLLVTHTGSQGTKIDQTGRKNILKQQLISKHKIKDQMDSNIFKTLMLIWFITPLQLRETWVKLNSLAFKNKEEMIKKIIEEQRIL